MAHPGGHARHTAPTPRTAYQQTIEIQSFGRCGRLGRFFAYAWGRRSRLNRRAGSRLIAKHRPKRPNRPAPPKPSMAATARALGCRPAVFLPAMVNRPIRRICAAPIARGRHRRRTRPARRHRRRGISAASRLSERLDERDRRSLLVLRREWIEADIITGPTRPVESACCLQSLVDD